MDDYYPSLKRPKKKLHYPTTKPRLGQWAQNVNTLEDVDKMFDDLDSNNADFPSPSPDIHIASKSKHTQSDRTPLRAPEEQLKRQMVGNGDSKHPHHSPASPVLDINSETPFKAHKPISTSSPIEGNIIRQENKGDNSASPILFDCEDEKQDLETAETPTEKAKDKNKRDESSSDFETLPKKFVSDDMSVQKREMVPKRSKPSSPPASPVRRKVLRAAPLAPEKQVQVSTKIKHDMTSFLQKLKDAGQPRPIVARMSQAKVLAPLPEPEPEDEFIILEEDVPFVVSIPNTLSKKTKERLTKASSSDTEAKGTSGEEHSANKLQDIVHDHRQQENPPEKTNKRTNDCRSGPNASNEDCLSLPMAESDSIDNVLQQSKKKTGKKVLSKNDKNTDTGTETDVEFLSKEKMKKDKTAKKALKSIKNDKESAQKKKTSRNEKRKGVRKAEAVSDEVEVQSQELHPGNQLDDNAPVSAVNNVKSASSEDLADENLGQNKQSLQEEMSDEDIVVGKRKRRPPGEWWIHSPHNPEQKAIDKKQTVKTRGPNKKFNSATSSGTAATVREKNNRKQSSSSSDSQRQNVEKKKVQKGKLKHEKPVKTALSVEPEEDFGQAIQDRALDQDSDSDSSPLLFPHRERSLSSGQRAFDKVYQNGPNEKKSSSLDRATSTRFEGLPSSRESPKRRRKAPGNWWEANPKVEDQELATSQPQQQKPKELKAATKKKKQPKKPITRSPSKPLEGASKQKKISLTTTGDFVSIVEVSPPAKKLVTLKKQSNVTTSTPEVIETEHDVLSIQMDQLPEVQDESPGRDRQQDTMQESISKAIISGPSSMIGLENYDDIELPSTTVLPALCASDLCPAPLRPLTLLPKDKVNLQVWLNYLWSTTDKSQKITTEDFEWYCHRNRAMGIMTDLQTGCICNGKMLLGSFMKKPLWVDHSATIMFNLLTSSVRVVMDCNKSQYSAGQSFMVPPGHAYSIHNLMPEPAVLYFTRFFTEEPDE